MKRKYVITGITCMFLFVTGVCYSCAYNSKEAAVLTSSESEESISKGSDTGESETEQLSNQESEEQSEHGAETVQTQNQENREPLIYVHICGAVVSPGVYQTTEGARLIDVIELSGGLNKEAAGDYINQAQVMMDGQRIYIPTKAEVKDLSVDEYRTGSQGTSENRQEQTLVNINTADAATLMSLPGIGQAKADSIIEYRNANGKFKTIEELMNISGIKEGLFHQLSSKIMAQ